MSVSEKDVLYVAELANLELTEKERARLLRDLNSILDYVNRLNELDTANVPPMAAVSEAGGGIAGAGSERPASPMRRDEPRPSLGREPGLQNAPETDGTFFKVPKVIDK